jgi:hypothetical protein
VLAVQAMPTEAEMIDILRRMAIPNFFRFIRGSCRLGAACWDCHCGTATGLVMQQLARTLHQMRPRQSPASFERDSP